MAKRDIVVIGGSAGSLGPLRALVGGLPARLEAAVFIATHVPAQGARHLRDVLARHSLAPVTYAAEGDEITPGRILIAPPDRHLLLSAEGVILGTGPRENMVRPAIDPLFRSAALAFGPNVVAVVLSGMLNDGAAGLVAVRERGGAAVVQDPTDAEARDMPAAALAAAGADHVVPAEELASVITQLLGQPAPLGRPPTDALRLEVSIARGGRLSSDLLARVADPVALSCPQCGGVLSEMAGATPKRFRCQIGHALTAEALEGEQAREVEDALRLAMRMMEERSVLVERMAQEASRTGRRATADLYQARREEYARYAETLRRALIEMMRGEAHEAFYDAREWATGT